MNRLTHLNDLVIRRVFLIAVATLLSACPAVAALQQSDNPPPQSSTPSAQSGHSEAAPPPTQTEKPAPAPKPPDPKKDDKKDTKTDDAADSKLKITVVAAETGKPIGSASVYIRFPEGKTLFTRKDKEAEMNFKTNQDGTVKVPGVPRGKTLIQIVAPGWHTFGKYYDIEKDEEEIQIKLDKPPRWY
jgi:hypothetical protein